MNNWLIVASLFTAATLAPSCAQMYAQMSGTCASIGHSTTCCPRGESCQATDGDCMCNSICHEHRDCCQDVHCPATPRTCADVGFTECCTDPSGTGLCDVALSRTTYCSCNVSCHLRGDCCPDMSTICRPRTCAEAGKSGGCCTWSTTSGSSCFVAGGNCYCDSYCHVFGDCCNDVPQCTAHLQSWRSQQSRLQSVLEQELTASQVQNYYRGRGINIEDDNSGYAHHRMALAARTQRVRANAREFGRGRARVAARPPGPPPYGYY